MLFLLRTPPNVRLARLYRVQRCPGHCASTLLNTATMGSEQRRQTLTSLSVTFLGTASAQPSSTRNHSALALRLNSDVWLFDCGEATQHQLQKSSLKMGKIEKIFITHTHGERIIPSEYDDWLKMRGIRRPRLRAHSPSRKLHERCRGYRRRDRGSTSAGGSKHSSALHSFQRDTLRVMGVH